MVVPFKRDVAATSRARQLFLACKTFQKQDRELEAPVLDESSGAVVPKRRLKRLLVTLRGACSSL